MSQRISRRGFLKGTAVAAGITLLSEGFRPNAYAQNSKLNLAWVATGGRGTDHLLWGDRETPYALCDVDQRALAYPVGKWPKAKVFQDYRAMFDQVGKEIDAVFVATPDHHHASAALRALRMKKAVYCEKPMTWSIHEARLMADETRKQKVATQMGNQGHASQGIRRIVEWVQSGTLGTVKEVHTWTNRPLWPQGVAWPTYTDPVPPTLDWDVWLGPAAERPFCAQWRDGPYQGGMPIAHPFAWRGWIDYGCGAIGDMGAHTLDCVWWAMGAEAPISAEVVKVEGRNDVSWPSRMIIRWDFPAKGKQPAWSAYWYEGGWQPDVPEEMRGDPAWQKQPGNPDSVRLSASGNLFVGDKGKLYVEGDYSDSPNLIPSSRMNAFKAGEMKSIERLAPSPGHAEEFLMAARGEKPWDSPKSNFLYAGPLVECMLLGNVACLAGEKILWDAKAMKIRNNAKANAFIGRPGGERKGWELA